MYFWAYVDVVSEAEVSEADQGAHSTKKSLGLNYVIFQDKRSEGLTLSKYDVPTYFNPGAQIWLFLNLKITIYHRMKFHC